MPSFFSLVILKGLTTGLLSEITSESDFPTVNLKVFTYAELDKATRNFALANRLGDGGPSHVFMGYIDERACRAASLATGTPVAVKRLRTGSNLTHDEMLSVVNDLGRHVHSNLVKLIGYCLEEEHKLLVCEYLPNGSLEDHLFIPERLPLSWETRVRIAMDVARGLSFLHGHRVIFRDLKAANVLLDSAFNAKLSDFGYAKIIPGVDPSRTDPIFRTRASGIEGYLAPEYLATDQLTSAMDVYSFGVLLLELVSGRRAVQQTESGIEDNIVEWAQPNIGSRHLLDKIMDTKLREYSHEEAYEVVLIASECVGEKAQRPRMRKVLSALEQLRPSLVPATASSSSAPVASSSTTHELSFRTLPQLQCPPSTIVSSREALSPPGCCCQVI
uniref:non-specific serine/threonine protein kinase n=1 Tax=Gossypium raimondii TaxID=29730 RepID=A0A0D2UFR9_GOSRA|nr:hypothetical protein B456_010G196400 [Gossypium raimondii]